MIELTHLEYALLAKHYHEAAAKALAAFDYESVRRHTERANALTLAAIEAEKRAKEKETDAGT